MLTIDDRLENWGACWRSRMNGAPLASKEGSYRSRGARHWDYATGVGINGVQLGAAPARVVRGDMVDAAELERAVCVLDLYHHVVLKGHYVRQWAPAQTVYEARKAVGDRRRDRHAMDAIADASLRMARALVGEVIDRPAVIQRLRAVMLANLALELPAWDDAHG